MSGWVLHRSEDISAVRDRRESPKSRQSNMKVKDFFYYYRLQCGCRVELVELESVAHIDSDIIQERVLVEDWLTSRPWLKTLLHFWRSSSDC